MATAILGIAILTGIAIIFRRLEKMAGTILDLQNEVTALTAVDESVIKLLDGLSQQLKDAIAQNDPAAIQKVVDDLDAQKANLAAAVTRNTPATTA